jgi:hypothetical protein
MGAKGQADEGWAEGHAAGHAEEWAEAWAACSQMADMYGRLLHNE